MVKKFFPEIHRLVSASSPHPENTQYKVSIGVEDWGGGYVSVIKVQMVYDGSVSGRKSPSYPLGTDDHRRVLEAVNELLEEKSITSL